MKLYYLPGACSLASHISLIWSGLDYELERLDYSTSRMFARYYAGHTLEEREVVQLRAPLRPGWFAPLIRADYKSDALPLWRFTLQPNYASTETTRPADDEVGLPRGNAG